MEVSPWVDDWVEEIVLVLGRKGGESQANQGAQKCENQHLKPDIVMLGCYLRQYVKLYSSRINCGEYSSSPHAAKNESSGLRFV